MIEKNYINRDDPDKKYGYVLLHYENSFIITGFIESSDDEKETEILTMPFRPTRYEIENTVIDYYKSINAI